jgi:hypothetical protein
MNSKVCAFFFFLTALISGCGSSGEDFASQDPSAAAISPNSFDIQEGWRLLTNYGYLKQFHVSGTCEGSMKFMQTSATEIFGHNYKNQALTEISYSTCSDTSSENRPPVFSTMINEYDYLFLDKYFETTNKYGVWQTQPRFPSAATVGTEGRIGEISMYDLNSDEYLSKEIWTYKISANTATTVLFNLIKTSYHISDLVHPTKTEQNTYLVLDTNELQLMSIHWVDDTGFVFHAQ